MAPAPRFFNSGAMIYLREAKVVPIPLEDANVRISMWRTLAHEWTTLGGDKAERVAGVYQREADELAHAVRKARAWMQTWGGDPPCAA